MELNSNFIVWMTAATLLSGVTCWLLMTPSALVRATKEVRSAFKTEDEIYLFSASAKLPYRLTCLDEALRTYPQVPKNVPRRCPAGSNTIGDGLEMPDTIIISVHPSSTYWSELNFHKSLSFRPERWPEATKDPSLPFFDENRAAVQSFSVGPRNGVE